MNNEQKAPPTCKDFTYRDGRTKKGCGAPIRLVKTQKGFEACEQFMFPALDKAGNFLYAWVPHWMFCEHEQERRDAFAAKQQEYKQNFRASVDDSGDSRNGNNYRQNSGGGSRNQGGYQGRPQGQYYGNRRADQNDSDIPF